LLVKEIATAKDDPTSTLKLANPAAPIGGNRDESTEVRCTGADIHHNENASLASVRADRCGRHGRRLRNKPSIDAVLHTVFDFHTVHEQRKELCIVLDLIEDVPSIGGIKTIRMDKALAQSACDRECSRKKPEELFLAA
jgi:hypothetical protein